MLANLFGNSLDTELYVDGQLMPEDTLFCGQVPPIGATVELTADHESLDDKTRAQVGEPPDGGVHNYRYRVTAVDYRVKVTAETVRAVEIAGKKRPEFKCKDVRRLARVYVETVE